MATTVEQLRELQKQVRRLQIESAETRRVLRERGMLPAGKRAVTRTRTLSERERVREILRDAGMLAELTPEEKAMAARWRALPEERKRHVIAKLRTTRLTPPLSESIVQDRE